MNKNSHRYMLLYFVLSKEEEEEEERLGINHFVYFKEINFLE